jgi:hypothetical protein
VTRAINAAKASGLTIVRVEIDAKTAKITVICEPEKKDAVCESWADAPMPQIGRKRKQE